MDQREVEKLISFLLKQGYTIESIHVTTNGLDLKLDYTHVSEDSQA